MYERVNNTDPIFKPEEMPTQEMPVITEEMLREQELADHVAEQMLKALGLESPAQ